MDFHKKKEQPPTTAGTTTRRHTAARITQSKETCTNFSCFFCLMNESKPSIRRAQIENCFEKMPFIDDQEHVLVLSGLWKIAMTQPDDPEFPSLGIFRCMASIIRRGLADGDWLQRHQNVYIPYYAAHVIGSYTINKVEFAEEAVRSGVIPPLMELLRGKMSWVEQRVAARALGHLASYETTFEAVAEHEEDLVNSAMDLASTCLEVVYAVFVGVKSKRERLKYHRDLLSRGFGGMEMENRKAEEWASQIQCWSLNLLNCFAIKERSINLICKQDFLKKLCEMWGGLVNRSSPSGVGLIRILCYSETGRKSIAESQEVIEKLCNLSRSSDDWQYMGIDCLRLLLSDPYTRYKIIEIATLCLADLIEIRTLIVRSKVTSKWTQTYSNTRLSKKENVGDAIARTLLMDFKQGKSRVMDYRVKKALEEVWDLKVERRKREKRLSAEKVEEKRVMVRLIKQEGNHRFRLGEIEEALLKYTEGLKICPVRSRKERMVLYSNRAECYLMLGDPDAAISDTTRALCLSSLLNSHRKSLWRRSQAYDMKGLAKESLMDCVRFVNGGIGSAKTKKARIPYYAARMISKQMESSWIFTTAREKKSNNRVDGTQQSEGDHDGISSHGHSSCEILRSVTENKGFTSGLATIMEEPLIRQVGSIRKMEKNMGNQECCSSRL